MLCPLEPTLRVMQSLLKLLLHQGPRVANSYIFVWIPTDGPCTLIFIHWTRGAGFFAMKLSFINIHKICWASSLYLDERSHRSFNHIQNILFICLSHGFVRKYLWHRLSYPVIAILITVRAAWNQQGPGGVSLLYIRRRRIARDAYFLVWVKWWTDLWIIPLNFTFWNTSYGCPTWKRRQYPRIPMRL